MLAAQTFFRTFVTGNVILDSLYIMLTRVYMFQILYTSKYIPQFIVTTPTQPQLNSEVGFDMKMTLHHPPTTHPPTHDKLNVINISAVPNPISTKLQMLDSWINNNMNNKTNKNKTNILSITDPILTKL